MWRCRSDIEEKELVKEFLGSECGCHLSEQKCCSLQFSASHVEEVRSHCSSLSHSELDMVLLGQLMAASNCNDTVVVASGHAKTKRIKAYTRFSHQGLLVCATMFRLVWAWRTWPRAFGCTDWPSRQHQAPPEMDPLSPNLLLGFYCTTQRFCYQVVCQATVDRTWSCYRQVWPNAQFGRCISNRPPATARSNTAGFGDRSCTMSDQNSTATVNSREDSKLLKTTSRVYSWSDPIIGQQATIADERSEVFSLNAATFPHLCLSQKFLQTSECITRSITHSRYITHCSLGRSFF